MVAFKRRVTYILRLNPHPCHFSFPLLIDETFVLLCMATLYVGTLNGSCRSLTSELGIMAEMATVCMCVCQ